MPMSLDFIFRAEGAKGHWNILVKGVEMRTSC